MLKNVNFIRIALLLIPTIQHNRSKIKPLIMKKIFFYLLALVMTSGLMGQRVMHIDEYLPRELPIDLSDHHFIKDYEPVHLAEGMERAGAVSFVELGSAYNLYTILLDEQNQVAYNPDLDAVTFVHRQNAGTTGGSGGLSYDRSLDGGATWTTNNIVTPNYNAGSAPIGGNRYPSIAIWNPTGNTNPANAYAIQTGPALQAGAAGWGWIFAHSAKLSDNSEVAEDYYQQVSGVNTDFHPYGLTVNPNGDVWSISTYFPDDGITDYSFFYLNKGIFNTTTKQVDWTLSQTLIDPDYYLDTDGSNVGGYGWNVAFGPDGQTGYAVVLVSENSCVYQGIQPIVYKTTNGGTTWTRLPDFDFRTLTAFQDYLIPTSTGDQIPFFTSEDIAVDADDRLHIFSNVLPRSSSSDDSLYFIWVGAGTEGMFHMTTSNGTDWSAALVDSVLTEAGAVGAVAHGTRTNISRSEDGDKIFFTWSASDASIIGTNDLPNLRIRGYSISTAEYTFTSEPTAGSAVDGVIFYPTVAPIAIETGSEKDYEIATVFAQPGASDVDPPTFFYIRGAGFNEADFGLTAPNAVADFSFIVNKNTVNFTNLSAEASDYVWDFGDSSPLTALTNPTKLYTALGTYNVCLTAKNEGTPDTDDTECKNVVITELASGLENDLLNKAITLFPSPSAGLVNLTLEGTAFGEITVQVLNLLGEEVLPSQRMVTSGNASLQLDLSDLATGQYLVKVQTNKAVVARTITISR